MARSNPTPLRPGTACRQVIAGGFPLSLLITALPRAFSFFIFISNTFAQAPLILEDADFSPDAIFLHRTENIFFASPFTEWENIRRLRLVADYDWTPTLDKTGSQSATLRAYEESQTLYYAIAPQADLKLARRDYRSDFTLKDSAAYVLGMHSRRFGFPFGALYHLVPQTKAGGRLDLLVDFHAVDHLEYTLGFDWMQAPGSFHSGGIRWQFSTTFRDGSEQVDFQDNRPKGTGEKVQADFYSRLQSTSSQLEIPMGTGVLALCARYTSSKPTLPRSEYNLTDSSQTLRLGLAYRIPQSLGSVWYAYEEGQARTIGLRVPPGSEGTKRFHYALTGTSLQEARFESRTWSLLRQGLSSLSLGGNSLTLRSSPPADAIDERKETLSYNRLGLSYIADIYGGFSRNGELVTTRGSLRQIEGTARHIQEFRGWRMDLALPMALSWIDFDLDGQTVDQGVFSTTVDRTYAYGRSGRILSVTPRLSVEWATPLWGNGILKLGGKVSQFLLMWDDVRNNRVAANDPTKKPTDPSTYPGGIPSPGTPVVRPTFPAGSNGFLGQLTCALDF